MANADDFKALAQDIANAHKDRVTRIKGIKNEVKGIKNETNKFIGTCMEEDKARAADVSKLKADVGRFIDECMKEDKARAADVSRLKKDADKLVDEFSKEHAAAASAWKGLLSTMATTSRKEKPSPLTKAAAKAGERELVGAGAGKKMSAKKGSKKRRESS